MPWKSATSSLAFLLTCFDLFGNVMHVHCFAIIKLNEDFQTWIFAYLVVLSAFATDLSRHNLNNDQFRLEAKLRYYAIMPM